MSDHYKRRTGLEFGSGNLFKEAKAGEKSVDDHQETSTLRESHAAPRRRLIDKPAIVVSSHQGSKPTLGDNLPSAASSKASNRSTRSPYKSNPWDKYEALIKIQLNAKMAIREDSCQPYAVSTMPAATKKRHLQVIDLLAQQAPNPLMDIVEMFDWKDELHIVTDLIDVSLIHIRISEPRLSERQLSYIMQEVGPSVSFQLHLTY